MATVSKKTSKTTAAAKPAAEKKPNLDNQMMTWTGAGRETNQNFITADKVNGKERWFIKGQIAEGSADKEKGTITIRATRREFRYRNMEEVATVL